MEETRSLQGICRRNLQALRDRRLQYWPRGSRDAEGVVNLILISEDEKMRDGLEIHLSRGNLNILEKIVGCQIQQKAFRIKGAFKNRKSFILNDKIAV